VTTGDARESYVEMKLKTNRLMQQTASDSATLT
jgi:hypothetical protein